MSTGLRHARWRSQPPCRFDRYEEMGSSVLGRTTAVEIRSGGGTEPPTSTGPSRRSAPLDAPFFAQALNGSGYRAVFEPACFLVFVLP